MEILIKEAGIEDKEHFLDLYVSFYKELYSKQGWDSRELSDQMAEVEELLVRDRAYIAYLDNEPIGFVRVSEHNGNYWIEELYVKPSYRGRGAGKKLLEKAEEYIKRHSSSAYTAILPQDKKALEFWMKMGYRIINTIELVKDFVPTMRSNNTRVIEILGYPFLIARWAKEEYSELEKEYLELLEKFRELGGTRNEFLELVIDGLRKWIRNRSSQCDEGKKE